MAKNYRGDGDRVQFTAGGTLASGGIYVSNNLIGVIEDDAVSGDLAVVSLCGVYELPKAAVAVALGEALYYDSGNANVTTTRTGNTFIGIAMEAVGSGVATVDVKLRGGMPITDEVIQDTVGAMFTGNTETGITATYQDSDGTIDLTVP